MASRYAKARRELFDGLVNILDQMNADELAGKNYQDTVLLAGQRMQLLARNVEITLRGLEPERW